MATIVFDLWEQYRHSTPVLALLSFIAIIVARIVSNRSQGKNPPICEGIPFIGGIIKFARGPMTLMRDGYGKCGEVFTVPVAHKRITFLLGPDVSPHFFKANDEEMSQKEVYAYSIATFGKGVVYDVDIKTRIEQIRFFSEALSKEKLRQYVPQFVMEAEQFLESWGEEGVVDLKKEFERLISLTAARTLLGREIRENIFEEVAGLLHDLDDGMMPISVLCPSLPLPAHFKRDRARVKLSKLFEKIVKERRLSGVQEEDLLQQFVDARYQKVCGGRQLTADEICGLLIASLFAGQHTSTITASWTGYFMIDNQDKALAAALQEQKQVMSRHGETITFEVLSDLEVLHKNITEALRLNPPLMLLLRLAKKSFMVTTSKGQHYVIPKGDIVAASPNFSHRLSTSFTNPDDYEPERFDPPREEDRKKPFTFIGFGGGRHGCIGQQFAYLQIKALWTVMLRNFEFKLVGPVPEPDYDAMVIGPKSGKVQYKRRKLTI